MVVATETKSQFSPTSDYGIAGRSLNPREHGSVGRCALPALKTGEVGVIRGIAAGPTTSKRLADMGFVQGARVEVVRRGTPCIVRLNGVCVGLGRRHQATIELSIP